MIRLKPHPNHTHLIGKNLLKHQASTLNSTLMNQTLYFPFSLGRGKGKGLVNGLSSLGPFKVRKICNGVIGLLIVQDKTAM